MSTGEGDAAALEAPALEAPALEAWSAIVAVYQSVLHDLVAVLEREVGMDSGVFSALAYLERADPPHFLRMSELQRLLHPRYSQPGFSRLISRMEADGLVVRTPDPDDGRAARIASTRVGRQRYQRANVVYAAEVQRCFGRFLTTEQCRALVTLVSHVGGSDGARIARSAPEAAAADDGAAPRAPAAP